MWCLMRLPAAGQLRWRAGRQAVHLLVVKWARLSLKWRWGGLARQRPLILVNLE